MTIAVDIRTGQVVGQVTEDEDAPDAFFPFKATPTIRLLTRDGYVRVPYYSVRLETIDSR